MQEAPTNNPFFQFWYFAIGGFREQNLKIFTFREMVKEIFLVTKIFEYIAKEIHIFTKFSKK